MPSKRHREPSSGSTRRVREITIRSRRIVIHGDSENYSNAFRFSIKIRISSSKALKKIAQLLLRDYTFYFYFYYSFIYIYKKLFLDENVDKIVEI